MYRESLMLHGVYIGSHKSDTWKLSIMPGVHVVQSGLLSSLIRWAEVKRGTDNTTVKRLLRFLLQQRELHTVRRIGCQGKKVDEIDAHIYIEINLGKVWVVFLLDLRLRE